MQKWLPLLRYRRCFNVHDSHPLFMRLFNLPKAYQKSRMRATSQCKAMFDQVLFLSLHHSPFFVWIVAPVTISTSSGDPLSSTSKFRSSRARATVDSRSANWSPTHLRGPPPKGRKAKSAMIW